MTKEISKKLKKIGQPNKSLRYLQKGNDIESKRERDNKNNSNENGKKNFNETSKRWMSLNSLDSALDSKRDNKKICINISDVK